MRLCVEGLESIGGSSRDFSVIENNVATAILCSRLLGIQNGTVRVDR